MPLRFSSTRSLSTGSLATCALATRSLLACATLVGLAIGGTAGPANAQATVDTIEASDPRVWHHAATLNDAAPRYRDGFAHFDYVNPDAPKGGRVRLADLGTFDSLNPVPPRGQVPGGLGLIYDTLMTPSLDELATDYGLIAEAVTYPDDFSSVTYRLRADARWHDGIAISPADVVFSFNALTEHDPTQAAYYSHVVSAEITGEREVTFTFDETGNRELPKIVGQLMVFPAHWWAGTDPQGNPRDISRGTLEIPLGSGPYRIAAVTAGRSIRYERVPDYWAGDLNVNVGHFNVDTVSYTYYRDSDVAFEAFKADAFDFRYETRARNWATGYDFEAVRDGRIVLDAFEQPYARAGLMVGFVFNTQRALFADRNVRRAFAHLLDFEELNRSLFFNSYHQYDSFFTGIEALASSGLPEGDELALLRELQADGTPIPEAIFTTPYTNPVGGSAEAQRENVRRALELFEAGGWTVRDEVDEAQAGTGLLHRAMVTLGLRSDPTRRVMRDAAGEPVVVELLLNGPTQEPPASQFARALELVGIDMVIRVVDSAQYTNRERARDFDMIYSSWVQSHWPGNEQRDFFGSAAATVPGSRNRAGIQNEAVDALIERIIFAEDRAALETATRAMDRVLLWNQYVVPGWGARAIPAAWWNRFGHPESLPTYGVGFPTIWWWDAERAAATGGAQE